MENNKKIKEITVDSTPEEIADYVSDRLMDEIRRQFAEIKARQPIQEPIRVEEVRSAEEVLNKHLPNHGFNSTARESMLKAMEIYASQFKK